MKRILFLLLLALTLTSLACNTIFNVNVDNFGPRNIVEGKGNVVDREVTVSGFDVIALEGQGDVVVTVGEPEGLIMSGEENLLDFFVVEVRDRSLLIRLKPNTDLRPNHPIVFSVGASQLKGISLAGEGSYTVNSVTTDDFNAVIAGSGTIDIAELIADTVDLGIAGSGDIKVQAGAARSLTIGIAGSGEIDTSNLSVDSANVTIPGSGEVVLWVTGTLEATILGSGDISYYGSPTVKQTILGNGNVISLGEK